MRHLLWEKVTELRGEGKTILVTTHYMHEAEVLCDRIFIMDRGKVVGVGPQKELIARETPGYVGQINGMTYAAFLAPGMIATTALFTAFFESSYGFYVRMTFESVFKAMLTTPIGVREVVLGEFMWVFVRAGLMAFGVSLVLLALVDFSLHRMTTNPVSAQALIGRNGRNPPRRKAPCRTPYGGMVVEAAPPKTCAGHEKRTGLAAIPGLQGRSG